MQGEIVRQRSGDRVLQQHFVGLQTVAIDGFDLRRIEIHGNDADHQKHAENYIQDRNARRIGCCRRQAATLDEVVSAVGRSGGGLHSILVSLVSERVITRVKTWRLPLPKYWQDGTTGAGLAGKHCWAVNNAKAFDSG